MIVAVIGGGPAGMMAAGTAAQSGHSVTLFEQNEKLGKKLYLTGKGRCNVTNAGGRDAFFEHVLKNPRFLYSAWAQFDNRAVMELLEKQGVALKTERGGRVFPVSDKSSDVLRAMERYVRKSGAQVRLHAPVREIAVSNGAVAGVVTDAGSFACDAAVVATGGLSYPQTGSTGDGYRFAEALGHTVERPIASLVALVTQESWPAQLAGITLKNIRLNASAGGKRVFSELGELLFTHFGISGPLVLSLSGVIAAHPAGTKLAIDFKPGLTAQQLDARLLRDLGENARKQMRMALHALLPARLLDAVLALAEIDGTLPVGELKKSMRGRLVETLQAAPLTVAGTRGIEEAVVTRGGVSVRQINASTMESRLVRGLYFAGEVIDVDATTGGYNLQIAWSTGALAGGLM